jgi:hypothetical protein
MGERDHRLASDAVEEAIRLGRVDVAIDDEKDVGAGRLGDLSVQIM